MRPTHLRSLTLLLIAGIGLAGRGEAACRGLPGPRLAAGGDCPTEGACHFPRWVPAEAAPLEELGAALAFDGAHAALGAPGGDAVYLYERVGATWIQQQRLEAPPSSAGAFGTSLALFGGRLVVGDPSDSQLGSDAGAAHLYLEVGGGWLHTQTLTDPTGVAGDLLGTSVAVTDTWVVAGAPGDSDGGRVHLFFEAAGWPWWTSLHDFATGTVPEAFGAAVAMHEQWLLIGDPLSDTHAPDTGAVFTFEQYDVFGFFQDLTIPATLEAGDRFGGAIDFDGERIAIGARGDDDFGNDAGAAYLFAFTESEVEGHEVHLVEPLAACGLGPGDQFGTTVGIDGERVVVGSPGKQLGAGRLQVFARETGIVPEAWSLQGEVAPSGGASGDLFGTAAAVSGDYALVGGPGADAAGAQSGAGYLVSLASSLPMGGECPCDGLATLTQFGTGKAGTAGVPELTLGGVPVPGESAPVLLANALAGATPLLLWGTAAAALPFDGGELYVADLHLEWMPTVDAAGMSQRAWDIPPSPGWCGASVVLQALLIDPAAAGSFQTAQSKGIEVTVGF